MAVQTELSDKTEQLQLRVEYLHDENDSLKLRFGEQVQIGMKLNEEKKSLLRRITELEEKLKKAVDQLTTFNKDYQNKLDIIEDERSNQVKWIRKQMELKIEEIEALNKTVKGKDTEIQELNGKLNEMKARCGSQAEQLTDITNMLKTKMSHIKEL